MTRSPWMVLTRLLGVVALLCAAGSGLGADAGNYAVVSLIGNELSVVTYRQSVGSSRDTNDHQEVALADDGFDRTTEQAVANAIRRSVPAAHVVAMKIDDPSFYGGAEPLAPTQLQALIALMDTQLKQRDVRWLVVVSRFRSDARLRLRDGKVGSGKLSGLGFYLDYRLRTRSTGTGERGIGFIAPFAYVSFSLVDLSTGSVVRSETATETSAISAAGSASGSDPWGALAPEQKVTLINRLIRKAVDENVPRVVAPV